MEFAGLTVASLKSDGKRKRTARRRKRRPSPFRPALGFRAAPQRIRGSATLRGAADAARRSRFTTNEGRSVLSRGAETWRVSTTATLLTSRPGLSSSVAAERRIFRAVWPSLRNWDQERDADRISPVPGSPTERYSIHSAGRRPCSSRVTSRASKVAGKSCPMTASRAARLRATGCKGTMSPYPVVVSVSKLK